MVCEGRGGSSSHALFLGQNVKSLLPPQYFIFNDPELREPLHWPTYFWISIFSSIQILRILDPTHPWVSSWSCCVESCRPVTFLRVDFPCDSSEGALPGNQLSCWAYSLGRRYEGLWSMESKPDQWEILQRTTSEPRPIVSPPLAPTPTQHHIVPHI